MAMDTGWRGVMVAPPNPLAGIGGALRHAFMVDSATRSLQGFGDLLARLDQPYERRLH
ncbi:MAG TPA: hypothetical protein VGX37_09900 [Allosphingosinicella sp.]|nr:hypothetical protein [Allosphingosinicella sp.]